MSDKLIYEIGPDFETQTMWVCSVAGCSACCFDQEFADTMGCARHGTVMVRQVRQFEGERLIATFTEQPA